MAEFGFARKPYITRGDLNQPGGYLSLNARRPKAALRAPERGQGLFGMSEVAGLHTTPNRPPSDNLGSFVLNVMIIARWSAPGKQGNSLA